MSSRIPSQQPMPEPWSDETAADPTKLKSFRRAPFSGSPLQDWSEDSVTLMVGDDLLQERTSDPGPPRSLRRPRAGKSQLNLQSRSKAISPAISGFVWGVVASVGALFGAAAAVPEDVGRSTVPPLPAPLRVLDGDKLVPSPTLTLVERARLGQEDALSTLSAAPPSELAPDEVHALSEGKAVRARVRVQELGQKLSPTSSSQAKQEEVEELLRLAAAPDTFRDAQLALAESRTSQGADLLNLVQGQASTPPQMRDFAASLLGTRDVHQQASAALQVVLDAGTVTECDKILELVSRAERVGDERAVPALSKFARAEGCGLNGRTDCYPCLRGDRAELVDALMAAKRRRFSRPNP